MATAKIEAGVCGFVTTVRADSEDGQMVRFAIESDCENVRELASLLDEVDAFSEIGAGYNGVLLTTVRERLRGCCAGCIVPPGIFKAMQVAAGLALPKEATITLER